MRRLLLMLIAVPLLATTATAQQSERYFPLNPHTAPVGMAGRWALTIPPQHDNYYQPIRVHLPTSGQVSFFNQAEETEPSVAPSLASLMVGYAYRFKISHLPEYPGVELYPSVELLDRMHPPYGTAEQFPIPIEFSTEEIELALNDRLVTKVVYLEQPQLADPRIDETADGVRIYDLPSSSNLLKEADLRGRPMAIIRLGGRIPDAHSDNSDFYGGTPPVLIPDP